MPNINERPVCHRAEDLVTYLYGEAGEADATDFAAHLEQCDSCRSEFAMFQSVHDSILLWRNEALGSAFSPAAAPVTTTVAANQFVRRERRLSALAALREFFSISPLWLRGAAAFAALLLCVLAGLTISRSWNQPVVTAIKETDAKYSQKQLDAEVQKQVDEKLAYLNSQRPIQKAPEAVAPGKSTETAPQVAVNHVQPRTARPKGLNRQEREQLAKDLRLIPRDEDELPFGLSEEPNQ
jgi:hypothetical protein